MDLLTVLKVMGRHWLLVLIAMMATAPAARAVGAGVDPIYEAKGTLLVLSPAKTFSADGKSIEVNPFTRSGNAERVAASAILTVTHTSRWKDRMLAAGADVVYDYRLASEVVIEVTVTGKQPQSTLDGLSTAIRLFEEELAQRQQRAGAPRDTWIYIDTLAVPDEPIVLLGSRIRATVGVGLLGVAVAACLAFIAEAFKLGGGRRARQGRRSIAPDELPLTEQDIPDAPPRAPAEPAGDAPEAQRKRQRRVVDRSAPPPASANDSEDRTISRGKPRVRTTLNTEAQAASAESRAALRDLAGRAKAEPNGRPRAVGLVPAPGDADEDVDLAPDRALSSNRNERSAGPSAGT